jgi:hypothetical protein
MPNVSEAGHGESGEAGQGMFAAICKTTGLAPGERFEESCTAAEYRNRGGSHLTSADFNGRTTRFRVKFSNVSSLCLQDDMQKLRDFESSWLATPFRFSV